MVVQKQEKKCTKKRDARAKLLFFLIKPIFFLRFRCRSRRWILKFLLGCLSNNDGDIYENVPEKK